MVSQQTDFAAGAWWNALRRPVIVTLDGLSMVRHAVFTVTSGTSFLRFENPSCLPPYKGPPR